ncbi:TMEM175 family protein [Nocardiopsis alba]|uniref:TMEM175 family protein n=1 Tax=Nocardiopsis alba TaxID=53437 RepID=UPI0005AA6BF9|nr:TMEM175 family protein [Nocardiopsis alba]
MDTGRIEAFSDGVLAIVITIMVLGLVQPEAATFESFFATTGLGLLSYLLSFVYVGIYWNNHHHMFQVADRVDGRVLWANLGLLFFISLLPFTTSWMDSTSFAQVPVILYGVVLLLMALAYFVLQSTIIRVQGKDSPLKRAIGSDWKGKASPVLYLVGIVAAILDPGEAGVGIGIALVAFVLVAVLWVIPDRRIHRFYRESPERDS